MRTLPLHAWLALALTVATVAPAAAGAGAWLAAAEWQASRERARAAQALDVVAATPHDSRRLAQLGVEAALTLHREGDVKFTKQVAETPGLTAVLQSPRGKQQVAEDYIS